MARPISASEPEQLAERLVRLLAPGSAPDALPPAAQRRLLTALVRAYALSGAQLPPVDAADLTADEVAVTAAALMRAKDVTSFELAALFNV